MNEQIACRSQRLRVARRNAVAHDSVARTENGCFRRRYAWFCRRTHRLSSSVHVGKLRCGPSDDRGGAKP